ncbi:phosphoribosylanthranilate isomerase [Phaeodactylibacter luteus]|uniref:N-(5'-phosphoribosyl)anthranilate isomerase n=1 Tax=Phaeodactylibacter luteus TaxID=1564516 RepID=A0A5C6S3Z6_9BACT|nr:phosphoribosylanthranilate isomerase [Phaeodactylibacter luteus]TXB69558.1 phosphoribosylanthranilate isomerase [Phaeodactylibacter luteus]
MIIKVCGMKEEHNITGLGSLAADWMGLIFYPKSPRAVTGLQGLPPSRQKRVGVVVNAEMKDALYLAAAYQLDFLQLHGDEKPEYCRRLKLSLQEAGLGKVSLIKAFGVAQGFSFAAVAPYAPYCAYFLFDTQGPGYGGHGVPFNWELLKGYQLPVPFLLSGGIGPDDVPALKAFGHPQWAGIDLNSRFELSPGLKDLRRLKLFINAFRDVPRFGSKN